MGASGAVIDAAYATHCEYQRPAFESPEDITRENFNKHLGDEGYVVPGTLRSTLASSRVATTLHISRFSKPSSLKRVSRNALRNMCSRWQQITTAVASTLPCCRASSMAWSTLSYTLDMEPSLACSASLQKVRISVFGPFWHWVDWQRRG